MNNTRVVFDNLAQVVERNDYYPFGLRHTDQQTQFAYTYNDKEEQRGVGKGLQLYGFRMFDSRIARFTGVDPISDQFPHVSTFNYAENRPITGIDLHGLQFVPMHDINLDNGMSSQEKAELRRGATRASQIASPILAEVGAGLTPAGPAIDAKDLGVAYASGDSGGMALAAIGFIPGAGDLLKGVGKAISKLFKSGNDKVIKSVDDILSNANPGRRTKGKTKQFEKDGGFDTAISEFDALNADNIKEIETKFGKGKTEILDNGDQITVRPGSSDGRPTLEIRNPKNGRGTEIRYNQ